MPNTPVKFLCLSSGFLLCLTVGAQSDSGTAWISTGAATLKAHELVYVPSENHKISELIWKTEELKFLEAGLDLNFDSRTSLRLKGKAGLSGDSKLIDYDWLDLATPNTWTNRSIHDVTEIPAYLALDMQLAYDVADHGNWQLSTLAGVTYTRVKWNAFGGRFVYSTFDDDGNLIGFRDDRFEISGRERSISYRQEWLAPYIGLSTLWSNGRAAIQFDVTASPFSFSWDRDEHWQRSLTFTEKFEPGWRATADVTLLYQLSDSTSLMMSSGVESYFKVLGRTKVFDQSGSSPTFYGDKDGAGASLLNTHASLGLRFNF